MKTIVEYLNEAKPKIRNKRLKGTFYHGSQIPEYEFFVPSLGYGDWDAIWVTTNESAAEHYSPWHHYSKDYSPIDVVFKINIVANKIAELDNSTANQLLDYYEESDLREIIPELQRLGFVGWETTGNIGRTAHDDIAIFDDRLLNVIAAKFRINGTWTEYIPIDECEEFVESLKEEVPE